MTQQELRLLTEIDIESTKILGELIVHETDKIIHFIFLSCGIILSQCSNNLFGKILGVLVILFLTAKWVMQ